MAQGGREAVMEKHNTYLTVALDCEIIISGSTFIPQTLKDFCHTAHSLHAYSNFKCMLQVRCPGSNIIARCSRLVLTRWKVQGNHELWQGSRDNEKNTQTLEVGGCSGSGEAEETGSMLTQEIIHCPAQEEWTD